MMSSYLDIWTIGFLDICDLAQTMSLFLESLSESWQLLTPCSSCVTLVSADEPRPEPQSQITIIFPNLIDWISVSVKDVQSFVNSHLPLRPDATVTHLLIYLFLKNTDPSVTYINNLRLLHTGRQYVIQSIFDLRKSLPLLSEVINRSATFQLFVTPHTPTVPIRNSISVLLEKSTEESQEVSMPAVTFAEAIIRKLRRMRRLSLVSVSSRKRTRSNLGDSATDVEETDLVHARPKFQKFRRVFRRHLVVA